MRIVTSLLVWWLLVIGYVKFSEAAVTATPTVLTIVIPAGVSSLSGTISAKNTGTGSISITWADNVPCLSALTAPTRVVAAGATTLYTLQANCPATGTATLASAGLPTISIPVTITKAVATRPGTPSGLLASMRSTYSLLLTWDPNSEPDLAGYKVYCGSVSKQYGLPTTLPMPHAPTATVSLLTPGIYFCAVTAYDTANNESGFSMEVSKTVP